MLIVTAFYITLFINFHPTIIIELNRCDAILKQLYFFVIRRDYQLAFFIDKSPFSIYFHPGKSFHEAGSIFELRRNPPGSMLIYIADLSIIILYDAQVFRKKSRRIIQ